MKLKGAILMGLVSVSGVGIAAPPLAHLPDGQSAKPYNHHFFVGVSRYEFAQANNSAAIAQQFVTQLATGQYAAAAQQYNATVSSTVTPQTLQASWNDVVNENGAFQGIRSTQVLQNDAAGTVVLVQGQFERGVRDLLVVMAGDRVVSFNAPQ